MTEQPQIYLISPPQFDPQVFPDALGRVLDSCEVACIRLALATQDEDILSRAADACRDVAISRDVAIVIDNHVMLAERIGLDGVHLTDAARTIRFARTTLGADAIVGSFCNTSRHDGLAAGEAGADYISFGPAGPSDLNDGSQVDPELFTWWSEMIEIPVVAEGALNADIITQLAPFTDFFGISEIWSSDDPAAALKEFANRMAG